MLRSIMAVLLLCFLAGCAAEPERMPLVLAQGNESGIAWRELDLVDEANVKILAWLKELMERGSEWPDLRNSGGHTLSGTKTIIAVNRESEDRWRDEIWLRDEITGEKKLILEGNRLDIREFIDERFFLYYADSKCFIFDTQRMMSIPNRASAGHVAVWRRSIEWDVLFYELHYLHGQSRFSRANACFCRTI